MGNLCQKKHSPQQGAGGAAGEFGGGWCACFGGCSEPGGGKEAVAKGGQAVMMKREVELRELTIRLTEKEREELMRLVEVEGLSIEAILDYYSSRSNNHNKLMADIGSAAAAAINATNRDRTPRRQHPPPHNRQQFPENHVYDSSNCHGGSELSR